MSQALGRPPGPKELTCGGPSFGELSGGNLMAHGRHFSRESSPPLWAERRASGRPLLLVLTNFCRAVGAVFGPSDLRSGCLVGAASGRGRLSALKIVTWLILPVVICLSQRLSHACLSISNHTVKLRMAH